MIHSFIAKLGIKSLGGQEYLARSPVDPIAAEVRTDARKMRVYGVCTSATVDRSREIVVPDGVDWSEYEKNPIVTTLHQWRDPKGIVGHAVIDGRFSVQRRGDAWHYGAQFIQSGPNVRHAEEAFALIEGGVLKGVSLGFRFLGAHSKQVVAPDGQPALRIEQCSPFEVTHLPVPDNPDALVHIVEKGVGGRRLSQTWIDLLRPMVPKTRFHGFTPQKREKAMAQPMSDPAAGTADPNAAAMQQQPPTPASQLPQVKPSIALLMATEQYAMGFIKFLKQQGEVQDHPEVKKLIGGLILHLSQAYRALSKTHQAIQSEDPTFPNLLGHGGLVAPDPAPPMPGATDAGVADPSAMAAPGGPGFGDGLDDVTGQEINAGMGGMDAGAPMTDSGGPPEGGLSDDDLSGLGDDPQAVGGESPYGDVGDEDQMPDAGHTEPDGDEMGGFGAGDGDGDEDEEGDDEGEMATAGPPGKKRKKGYEPREDMIVLVREKGLPMAFERARRMLEAYEDSLKREFQATDVNVLRWASENIGVMTPKQQQQFSNWCREKAMQGIARQAAEVKPPVPGSPEFFEAVEAETRRLVEAARIKQ